MSERQLQQIINPRWIKPTMTVYQAVVLADKRGCILKASYSGQFGMRVVAVPREHQT